MDGSARTNGTPKRAPWCALGGVILFGIPTGRFLFSWYQPYLSGAFLEPAIDSAVAVLGMVALPSVIWLRASRVGRSRWVWAGLSLAGALLGLLNPLAGLAGEGLPAIAYAATGLTSITRPTGKRDTGTSWVLMLVGGPVALFVCWLAFNLSYISDFRLGPPPFISTPPAYAITLRADTSGLSPESRDGALLASRKTILQRLKESTVGVVSARLGSDGTVKLWIYSTRNQQETIALASSRGALEVVGVGETPVAVGSTLDTQHRAAVSGLRLRIVGDWRYDEKLLVRDVTAASDQSGRPGILLRFDDEGARALRELTSASVGKYVAMAVDDVVIACPRIEAPISDGVAAIQGVTSEQARLVALELKFGELAVPFSVGSVEPTAPTVR